jgi:hypothetical protein
MEYDHIGIVANPCWKYPRAFIGYVLDGSVTDRV